MWVAGGVSTNDVLAYSYDGINWSSSTNGSSFLDSACTSVAWNGTIWVATGQGTYSTAYSYDGITWSGSTNSQSIVSTGFGVASIPAPSLYPPIS
jgi:hypothetical protein